MNEARLRAYEDNRIEPSQSLEVLADQQGVRPLQDIQQLRNDFWPEDENPEAFVDAVRNWRREEKNR